jgi:hypothetical protein
LPEKKVSEIKALIISWDCRRKVTKLELQQMVGKLNWAARVIWGGQTFLHAIIDLLCRENHHYVRLSEEARLNLSWWKVCFDIFNGVCPFSCDISLPSYHFVTDACEQGGGRFLLQDWFYVNWALDYPEMLGMHINQLELFTVVIALRRWGSALRNTHVRVRSDNMSVVVALNKVTSHSPLLMNQLREIFWLCMKHDITLSCVYIPRCINYLADRVSRLTEFSGAMDARLLLTNFSNAIILGKSHISLVSFVYLQELWMRHSQNYAEKRLVLNAVR